MHTQFWSEILRRRDCLEDIDIDEGIMLDRVLGK